jgi:hypothetical protein
MNGNEALRQALDVQSTGFPIQRAKMLADLGNQYGHSITTEQPTIPLDQFNCFAYAFGITRHPQYQDLVNATKSSAAFNSGEIKCQLGDGELTIVDEADAKEGDAVIYLSGGRVTHAGQILSQPGRISSKWGANELHAHGLWEVPASYGDDVLYVKAPDAGRIIQDLIAKRGA